MVDPSLASRFLACLSYGLVSISITLFNKAVFSIYKFNYPNLVTTLQIGVSILYLVLLRAAKWMDFDNFKLKTARSVGSLAVSPASGDGAQAGQLKHAMCGQAEHDMPDRGACINHGPECRAMSQTVLCRCPECWHSAVRRPASSQCMAKMALQGLSGP